MPEPTDHRGYWPTDTEALEALQRSIACEPDGDGYWLINETRTSPAGALALAKARLALGYDDVSAYMTSEMFGQLVKRIVDLERDRE